MIGRLDELEADLILLRVSVSEVVCTDPEVLCMGDGPGRGLYGVQVSRTSDAVSGALADGGLSPRWSVSIRYAMPVA